MTQSASVRIGGEVTFAGEDEEDIYDFIISYESQAEVNDWDDAARIKYLNFALKSSALAVWRDNRRITAESTWDEAKKELIIFFRKSKKQLEAKLKSLKFKEEDNVYIYTAKVKKLAKQIKPQISKEELEEVISFHMPRKFYSYFLGRRELEKDVTVIEIYDDWLKYDELTDDDEDADSRSGSWHHSEK